MRKRTWLCLLGFGVSLVLGFHQSILRCVASGLIINDPIENCQTLFVVGGDRCYGVAAQLFAQDQVEQIALLQGPVTPLVESQILPPGHEITRREIVKRGVPAQAIVITPGETRSIWEIADRVDERLAAHTDERIAMIVDRMHSRRLRFTLEQTLTSQKLSQVHIYGIRDRRFDETNWWRSRTGIKAVVDAYVRGIHTALCGRSHPFSAPDWKPETLEQRLLAGERGT